MSQAYPGAPHDQFAQRLAPDFGYLCGILNQVSTGALAGLGAEPPLMVTVLPQLMRKGYQTPYHFTLSRSFPALSRVGVYGEYAAIAPLLTRDAMDDWTTVREKFANANASLIFSALEDDDPLG